MENDLSYGHPKLKKKKPATAAQKKLLVAFGINQHNAQRMGFYMAMSLIDKLKKDPMYRDNITGE